jgi:hypothetical protein
MKKLFELESLVFLCSMMFGAVILPTFTMVILAFLGLMPRNASLAECYDALRKLLEPNEWVFWLAVLGPYLIVQASRTLQWKRRGGPWYREKHSAQNTISHSQSSYCEFSMMTWRDGLDELNRPTPDRKESND